MEADYSIAQLENLVQSGAWKNDAAMVFRIADAFIELQRLSAPMERSSLADFGTVEFWDAFYQYREAGSDSDGKPEPKTIYEWQRIIESGVWKDQPDIINHLFDLYLKLIRGHQREGDFGTEDFWNAFGSLVGIWDDNSHTPNDEWILPSEYEQKGGGNLIEDENDEKVPASHYYELGKMFEKRTRRFRTAYGQYDFR